jgi:DNA-binding transcriptional ArsR family regulator
VNGHVLGMIETFAALAEPNRLRIVEYLRGGPRSVREIETRLKLNQPQASQHLRVLRQAGLVDVQPRAQQRVYRLRPQALRALNQWVGQYRALWDDRLAELDTLVDAIARKVKGEERTKRRGR